jgi:DNA invertase Pin-like site-specific DNA recombinase
MLAKKRHVKAGVALSTHIQIGEKNPYAKLTDNLVRKIHSDFASGWSRKEIATQLQIPISTLKDILRGRTWKHIFYELHP